VPALFHYAPVWLHVEARMTPYPKDAIEFLESTLENDIPDDDELVTVLNWCKWAHQGLQALAKLAKADASASRTFEIIHQAMEHHRESMALINGNS